MALDWITGESEVRGVAPGETVAAGAINAGRTPLRLGALEGFATSRLARLLETAGGGRALGGRGRRWWHGWARCGWRRCSPAPRPGSLLWLARGLDRALEVTVAMLVVTCPCALGLAMPLAHELVHAALRRRGVFLRGGTFLDQRPGVRKVMFDKTGTLTAAG